MGFRINTNVNSLRAQNALRKNTDAQQQNLAQMSSGSRINKSSDDAAGLAISEKLKSQVRSLNQAGRNANDGISMIQVAEGGLNEVSNILTRLRELSIQSASDTISDTERGFTNREYQQIKSELQRIVEVTGFNGNKLINGEGLAYEFQVGINNDAFQDRIEYNAGIINAGLEALNLEDISVHDKTSAQDSLEVIDEAVSSVAGQRSELGALQNRLQSTINNIEISTENMLTANSRIRDVDYAQVTADNAKANILKEAGTAVLAQANNVPAGSLRLLG